MALQSSGAISLNDVNVELGNSGTASINMGSAAVRDLFGIASGAISLSDGYGASSVTPFTNTYIGSFTHPTAVESDLFGKNVAVSGNYVVVSEDQDDGLGMNSGAVHIYNTSGTLLHTLHSPAPAEGERFGWHVSISGNLIVVGTPNTINGGSARVYNTSGTLLFSLGHPSGTANAYYGAQTAISESYIAVSAKQNNSNNGAVYLYNTSGTLLHTINPPSGVTGDYFGNGLAVSDDYVVITSMKDGPVYQDHGEAYIYNTSGVHLHTIPPLSASYGIWFGMESVAISGDYIVIGVGYGSVSPNYGAVGIYNTSGTLLHTITSPEAIYQGRFGTAVSISGDYIAVGATFHTGVGPQCGAVHIYNTSGTYLHKLYAPDGGVSDAFGNSVSIDNGFLAVGMWYNTNPYTKQNVYLWS